MLYALILTVFLGVPGNMVPVETEILFETEKACEKALDSATVATPLPIAGAQAKCEKRPQT